MPVFTLLKGSVLAFLLALFVLLILPKKLDKPFDRIYASAGFSKPAEAYKPACRSTGNIILASRINPVGQGLLTFFPLPNYNATPLSQLNVVNYFEQASAIHPRRKDVVRLDANFNSKVSGYTRFINDPLTSISSSDERPRAGSGEGLSSDGNIQRTSSSSHISRRGCWRENSWPDQGQQPELSPLPARLSVPRHARVRIQLSACAR